MENFREKLKIQNLTIALGCIILTAFTIMAALAEAGVIPFFVPTAGDSHWQSMWRGFICGASFGILALMLFGLVRNILALKDEKKLKKLYIKANDERTIQVQTSAQAAALQTCLLLGLVAIMVSGYFSMTVSLTILGCVFTASVIGVLFKIYYSKKF